jgi:hypothetical protein
MPLVFTDRFIQNYENLPEAIRRKVDKTILILDTDFRYPGLHSHPVQGVLGIYEAYVDRKYRLTFNRDGENIILRNVDNHDDYLKNP